MDKEGFLESAPKDRAVQGWCKGREWGRAFSRTSVQGGEKAGKQRALSLIGNTWQQQQLSLALRALQPSLSLPELQAQQEL